MAKENKAWGIAETPLDEFVRLVQEEADADPTGQDRRELDSLRKYHAARAARRFEGGPRDLVMEVGHTDGKLSITVFPEPSSRQN